MTPLVTARVLAGAVVVACLGVLTAVAVHSAGLGPNPVWSFDCNDTTCDDLWKDAREHYRTVGFAALVVGVASWFLLGTTLRRTVPTSTALRSVHGSTASALEVTSSSAVGALAPVVLVAMLLFSGWTLPGVLAVSAGSATLASLLLWCALRVRTGRERYSWFAAAVVVASVFGTGALTSAILFPALFLLAPLAAALPAGIAGLVAVRIARTHARPGTSHKPTMRESFSARTRLASTSVAVIGVLLIGTVSAFAARPVLAPHSDAVTVGEGTTPVQEQPAREGSDPLDVIQHSPVRPVPHRSPAGLPLCGIDDLVLELSGWDFLVGDSAAELVASNAGFRTCALVDAPRIRILQGGNDLDIRTSSMESHRLMYTPPPDGFGLAPGESAKSVLFWRGYRSAADQTTPQEVEITLGEGSNALPVGVSRGDDSSVGPAPFDVVEGAEIHSSLWLPRPNG